VTAIEFRLLGPLEIYRDGAQVDVPGAKPRALLAVLLLHVGEVVSADRLIDAVWGERPPRTAANTLQAHVAALRRVLGPDVVLTRAPGYELSREQSDLDIARFEDQAAAGHAALAENPDRASRLLTQALALWRGPALADFAFESFAQADGARLDDLRLAALEDRIEADLALGRHAQAVPELEALLTEHPLRERLAGQLIVALYRSGRQAEASRVFHAIRTRLSDELGMEPQPALRELHDRILVQDPALGWAAPDHNLPAELTSFVGRARELDEIDALLHRTRLLTLTGAGGSGKTRLALRVARRQLAEYRDGVRLVELAPLADPALVESALATALGVRDQGGSLTSAILNRLGAADALIVLDNCEHVIGACADLAHGLLTNCERLRILSTSREPLRVPGEVTWPVPALELPAAAELFRERAEAAVPGLTFTHADDDVITLICRRLDGIPLAIELAAARIRALTPQEILQRVDDRFRLLTGGSRDVVERHQTLRAAIDWSHDLLRDEERVLFRRLAVFAGGWTAESAEAVCGDGAFDVLCELVDRSLVVADRAGSDTTRYRMLETIRQYAAAQLKQPGEDEAVSRRHMIHYLELTQNAGLATITAEQDNLRAALEFAHQHDPIALLRLAAGAEQFWLAGNLLEGRRWLTEALATAPEPTTARVRALNAAAALAAFRLEHGEARQLVQESVTIATDLGDLAGEAGARLWLGFVGLTQDPPDPTEARRSLELHQQIGDPVGICRSLVFLGISLSRRPETRQEGMEVLSRALSLAQELRDDYAHGFARTLLAWSATEAGDRAAAQAHLSHALAIEAIGPVRATAIDTAAMLALPDDPRRALRLAAASAALRARVGARPPAWITRREDAIRAEAEAQLDPADGQTVWAEGSAMSTDEALVYARAMGA
jgi:predicted ATPase/DNA-binding SARP family transcriptional activator